MINLGMEKLEIAQEYMEKLLEIEPENKYYLSNYALVLYHSNKLLLSYKISEKALEIDPNLDYAINIKQWIEDLIEQDQGIKRKVPDYKILRAEAREQIEIFEFTMTEFLIEQLKNYYEEEWWTKGVPSKVRIETKKRLASEKRKEPHRDYVIYEFLTLNETLSLVTYGNNWNKIFSHIFPSKPNIQTYFENIRDIRNRVAHYRKRFYEKDLKKLEVSLDEIYKYVSIFLSN